MARGIYYLICGLFSANRYIAKTLYGEEEEEEEVTPQNNSVEEPKLLGLNPGSSEKVKNVDVCISWLRILEG